MIYTAVYVSNESYSPAETDRSLPPSRNMESAYLELLAPGMLRIALATVAVALVVFTVVGPIGTFIIFTAGERLLYFLVAAFFSWPICYALEVVTVYLMRSRRPLQVGLGGAVVMLVASFPTAAIGHTFQALFYSQNAVHLGFLTIYLMAATATLACHVVVFYALCQRLRAAATDSPSRTATAPAPPAPYVGETGTPEAAAAEPRRPLFDRVPLDPGSDLVFLKTDGRYVEVHTTTGSSRVIARFADAVSQLGDVGMQVHRSYWVAHRHTTELLKRDTHTLVRVTGGKEIPVSRTYLAAVRAAVARLGLTDPT